MTPRAIVALGIGQCVNWGVLYYAFAVLVVPLERFLPVTGLSVAAIGWRGAVLVLAAMLAGSMWATRVWVFRHRPAPSTGLTPPQSAGDMPADESNPPGFLLLAAMFALASLAGAAFTSNVCTFALSVLLYARFAHKTDSPCRHASRQVLWKSRDDAAFRM